MTQQGSAPKPIGYWLKQADQLITAHVNAAQSANGVTRSEWQILNTIAEVGTIPRQELADVLRIFVDMDQLDAALAGFVGRGWIAQQPGADAAQAYELTPQGRERHAEILSDQQAARARLMEGISQEDYETTLRVLQRIVENLGGEPARG